MRKALAITLWRIGIIFCKLSENLFDFQNEMSDFDYWNNQEERK